MSNPSAVNGSSLAFDNVTSNPSAVNGSNLTILRPIPVQLMVATWHLTILRPIPVQLMVAAWHLTILRPTPVQLMILTHTQLTDHSPPTSGDRGRSKKWKEMLRLPPVAQCLCLRDEIGEGRWGECRWRVGGQGLGGGGMGVGGGGGGGRGRRGSRKELGCW